VATCVSRGRKHASLQPIQPSLPLTEGKDDQIHFSGPPRRWGGPGSSAKSMVCRAGENACPRRNQPSVALTEGTNDETHFSGPPRRRGEPKWRVATCVSR